MDSKTIYTGDSEGRLVRWNTEDGRADEVKGKGHAGAQINSLKWAGDHLVTAGPSANGRSVDVAMLSGSCDTSTPCSCIWHVAVPPTAPGALHCTSSHR